MHARRRTDTRNNDKDPAARRSRYEESSRRKRHEITYAPKFNHPDRFLANRGANPFPEAFGIAPRDLDSPEDLGIRSRRKNEDRQEDVGPKGRRRRYRRLRRFLSGGRAITPQISPRVPFPEEGRIILKRENALRRISGGVGATNAATESCDPPRRDIETIHLRSPRRTLLLRFVVLYSIVSVPERKPDCENRLFEKLEDWGCVLCDERIYV